MFSEIISKINRDFLIIFLCVSTSFYFILYHFTNNASHVGDSIKLQDLVSTPISTPNDNIDCHYTTEGDALRSAAKSDFLPPPDSIFFHETSCRGALSSRAACAIESAARAHPARKVYVLFSGPVSESMLSNSRSSLFQLRRYQNIEFARVHINEYAKGTPLQEFLLNRPHNSSSWKIVHTSDLLRVITLYKFGGLYLDTDFVVLKCMDSLGRDWLAKESDSELSNAAMSVGMDDVGRELITKVLEEVGTSYRPDLWAYNGPEAVERVLANFCNTTEVKDFSKDTCRGFHVYKPTSMYPVSYQKCWMLFVPGEVNIKGAYAVHLWSKLSKSFGVQRDSPYDKLSRMYCPVMRGYRYDSTRY